MAKKVRIPTPLRKLTNNEEVVEVKAETIGDAIVELQSRYPGMKERLVDDNGEVRRFVNVYVNEEDIQDAMFGIYPEVDFWIDLAADRHRQGANLSFADGHAENWHWQSPKRFLYWGQPASDPADLRDLRRLQEHIRPWPK